MDCHFPCRDVAINSFEIDSASILIAFALFHNLPESSHSTYLCLTRVSILCKLFSSGRQLCVVVSMDSRRQMWYLRSNTTFATSLVKVPLRRIRPHFSLLFWSAGMNMYSNQPSQKSCTFASLGFDMAFLNKPFWPGSPRDRSGSSALYTCASMVSRISRVGSSFLSSRYFWFVCFFQMALSPFITSHRSSGDCWAGHSTCWLHRGRSSAKE